MFSTTGLHFDRQGMRKRMGSAKSVFLRRSGALVMQTARQSIRSSSGSSKPGDPPRGHGQQKYQRSIHYGIDEPADQTVIGPINLNQSNPSVRPVKGKLPAVLEHGGQVFVKEVFKFGKWRPYRSSDRGLPVRVRKVFIQARPTMGPAMASSAKKLPGLMAGTFK